MVTAAAAAASLIVAGLAAGLGRLAGGTAKTAGVSSLPSTAAPRAAGTAVGSQGTVPSGKAIGPASDVPVGQAASFTDPATGDPSIVIQPRAGKFVAFDAVCPHTGCTVSYDPTAKLIVCPCHGSEFSASTGAVELGPAAAGLTRITIAEGQDGQPDLLDQLTHNVRPRVATPVPAATLDTFRAPYAGEFLTAALPGSTPLPWPSP